MIIGVLVVRSNAGCSGPIDRLIPNLVTVKKYVMKKFNLEDAPIEFCLVCEGTQAGFGAACSGFGCD